uniref:Galectin n=1 Tax=Callorhinchus milii TaxID=7868 RepID=A0A4W3GNI2_CALMI
MHSDLTESVRNIEYSINGILQRLLLSVLPGCRFTVNLGKDDRNIALHFDPRFNFLGGIKKIFMATRNDGEWGHQHQDDNFPFYWGKQVEIMIAFLGDTFEINLSTGHRIVFQNSLKMEILTYMSVANMTVSDIKFC